MRVRPVCAVPQHRLPNSPPRPPRALTTSSAAAAPPAGAAGLGAEPPSGAAGGTERAMAGQQRDEFQAALQATFGISKTGRRQHHRQTRGQAHKAGCVGGSGGAGAPACRRHWGAASRCLEARRGRCEAANARARVQRAATSRGWPAGALTHRAMSCATQCCMVKRKPRYMQRGWAILCRLQGRRRSAAQRGGSTIHAFYLRRVVLSSMF